MTTTTKTTGKRGEREEGLPSKLLRNELCGIPGPGAETAIFPPLVTLRRPRAHEIARYHRLDYPFSLAQGVGPLQLIV